MTSFKQFVQVTALSLLSLTVWGQDKIQNFDDLAVEDCALIKDGITRLACYDEKTSLENAGTTPTPEKREATKRMGVTPTTSEETLSDGASNAGNGNGDEDGDRGVMKNLVNRYVAAEKALFSFSGSFVSHRPMYIMPLTWTPNPNQNPFSPRLGETGYDDSLDKKEVKYQISFKVPLFTGWLDNRTTLWFGYTQLSFWQVYDTDNSAPFRETNYEPEIFLRYQADYDIGPGTLNVVSVAIDHQSNGQSEPKSRSWNRIVGNAVYSYDRWLFMVSPWLRIPDGEDDNPDIEEFAGYADYWAVYKWDQERTLSLKLRNNLRAKDNKTSIQLGYSFPMGGSLKGYVQYFNGYGESLIDYNERIHRIGIGIMLNDWL
ncbi:phospholipase A [Marinobacter caseinilyticus]|uniref:phospholipase A n=1 Tax=Marinobacter caseinilyticus TaxID=2692195 RepID=UPI00140AE851|nr:phospholipase A [Marinobacter caseinilyticus]